MIRDSDNCLPVASLSRISRTRKSEFAHEPVLERYRATFRPTLPLRRFTVYTQPSNSQ